MNSILKGTLFGAGLLTVAVVPITAGAVVSTQNAMNKEIVIGVRLDTGAIITANNHDKVEYQEQNSFDFADTAQDRLTFWNQFLDISALENPLIKTFQKLINFDPKDTAQRVAMSARINAVPGAQNTFPPFTTQKFTITKDSVSIDGVAFRWGPPNMETGTFYNGPTNDLILVGEQELSNGTIRNSILEQFDLRYPKTPPASTIL